MGSEDFGGEEGGEESEGLGGVVKKGGRREAVDRRAMMAEAVRPAARVCTGDVSFVVEVREDGEG